MDIRSFLSRIGQNHEDVAEVDDIHSENGSGNDSDDGPLISIRKKKDRSLLPEFRRRSADEAKGIVVSLLPTINTQKTAEIQTSNSQVGLHNRSTFVAAALRHKRKRDVSIDELLPTHEPRKHEHAATETTDFQSYVSDETKIVQQLSPETEHEAGDELDVESLLTRRALVSPESDRVATETITVNAEAAAKPTIRRKGLLELAKGLAKEAAAPPKRTVSWAPHSKSF